MTLDLSYTGTADSLLCAVFSRAPIGESGRLVGCSVGFWMKLRVRLIGASISAADKDMTGTD